LKDIKVTHQIEHPANPHVCPKNLLLILALTALSATAAVTRLPVGLFSQQTLTQWEEHSFQGHTQYQLTRLEGVSVLKAESEAAASGLFRKIRVDLEKTPISSGDGGWRTPSLLPTSN